MIESQPLRLVVIVFAVYRVARIIAWDNITIAFRAWMGRQSYHGRLWRFLADLVHCVFCTGVWIAVPAAVAYTVENYWLDLALIWLGIAGAQAFLEALTHKDIEE